MALPLDALTPAHPLSAPLREASLPPEHRLEMPVQSLLHWSNAEERPLAAPERARAPWLARMFVSRAPWLARMFVFGGAALLTAYGAHEMYQVVSVSRTTVLQWVLLALFTLN